MGATNEQVDAELFLGETNLPAQRGLSVRTPRDPQQRSGMVCLEFEGADRVTDRLCEQGIIVDWRPDCGLRVSPHFYNTDDDINRFFGALDDARSSD